MRPADDVFDDPEAAAAFQPDRIVLNGRLHLEPDIQARLEEMCKKLLANTVIENFSIELV